jgi:hypothetical protein
MGYEALVERCPRRPQLKDNSAVRQSAII